MSFIIGIYVHVPTRAPAAFRGMILSGSTFTFTFLALGVTTSRLLAPALSTCFAFRYRTGIDWHHSQADGRVTLHFVDPILAITWMDE